RSLASDPGFSRRFRAHHRRNPPLIGCLVYDFCQVRFQPTLERPNRVPQSRFPFPIAAGGRFRILGCRHGLVLIFHDSQKQLLVWDPVTRDQHSLDIPPGFNKKTLMNAAVRRAIGDFHHFQVVLVGNSDMQCTQAVASVYSSSTRVWDKLISTPLPSENSGAPTMVYPGMPAVMVGDSFYWLLCGNSQGILEFDLDKQSLALIPMPMGNTADMRDGNIWVMLAEGGGLGFVFLRGFLVQLWKRRTSCKGVASWLLGRTVELDKLLSLNLEKQIECPRILGFAEVNNVVLLWTLTGIFTVQFELLHFKKVLESKHWYSYYPFEGVYTMGALVVGHMELKHCTICKLISPDRHAIVM
uniref:F-box protein AT5G49610-like beta-propeller domain-containing protein n=1 Tax=Aegilops tauschii subsp. strangulata TaxID=200361 RepID=A0A453MY64_AEGTS